MYQKKPAHVFFLSLEILSKLRFKISKLIFFEKKNRNLKNTHTQSLEISPNADSKETKSRKHVFFSQTKMSLS